MTDAIRYHATEHHHAEDRQRGIWRRHTHRHPHSPADFALHDQPGLSLDAHHSHEHLASHEFGTLLRIDDPPMGNPVSPGRTVRVLEPAAETKAARIAAIAENAPDLSIRAGYKALQGDLNKAALLDEAEQPVSVDYSKLSKPDILKMAKAEVTKAYAESPLNADLERLRSQMDQFCSERGLLGRARPETFIGKSAPNPAADALDRKAEAWAPIDRDASAGYRQKAAELRQSGATSTPRRR